MAVNTAADYSALLQRSDWAHGQDVIGRTQIVCLQRAKFRKVLGIMLSQMFNSMREFYFPSLETWELGNLYTWKM